MVISMITLSEMAFCQKNLNHSHKGGGSRPPVKPTFTVEGESKELNLTLYSTGGERTLSIYTNQSAPITEDLPYWITVTESGRKSITIIYEANNSDSPRYDWFTIKSGKLSVRVNVTQPVRTYTDNEVEALLAKLNNAENQIANLRQQLDACLRRPSTVNKVYDCEGLFTVYFFHEDYRLTPLNKTLLKSVAAIMQESGKKYVLTGYQDNYTGTDEFNSALRENRVNTVKNYLIACGVNPEQLILKTDANNLTDFGARAAPLDRAVTIRLAD